MPQNGNGPKFHPSSTYVFLVGNDEEDEIDLTRDTIGDEAFRQCLEKLGNIPSGNIIFIQDEHATESNIRTQFVNMLKRTRPGDSLLIYYAGHGEDVYYCTKEGGWRHDDIVDAVELYFKGEGVWIFSDCCYAGNVYKAVENARSKCADGVLRCFYLCVGSTTPELAARDDWTFTTCLVRALKREDLVDARKDGIVTIEEVLSFMADEVAREKRDLVTVYAYGDFNPNTPFFGTFSTEEETTPSVPPSSLPLKSESWMGVSSCAVGDNVYAKWTGGRPTVDSPYAMPLWFLGSVISVSLDDVQVEVFDPITSFKWTMTTKRECLLEELHFTQFEQDSEGPCVDAQIRLANKCMFISQSIPVDTHLRVLWQEDDCVYAATTMSENCVDWETYQEEDSEFYEKGPSVPVGWNEEETKSVMPLSHCLVCDKDDVIDDVIVKTAASAQLSMFRDQKFLSYSYPAGTSLKVLRESNLCPAVIVSAKDVIWKNYQNGIPDYENKGPYVPVCWVVDGRQSMVPLGHCFLTDDIDNATAQRKADESAITVLDETCAPRQILRWSFESAGKRLCDGVTLFGMQKMNCYWAEDGRWLTAQAAKLETVHLEILAGHVCYKETGDYYAVCWDEDDSVTLLPRKYIKHLHAQI